MSPWNSFRQGDLTVFIGEKGVQFHRRRIADLLGHIAAFCILQLEGSPRQGNRFAGFRVDFDHSQPVVKGLIIQNQRGRVFPIFCAVDSHVHGVHHGVPFLTNGLPQHIYAIGQGFGCGAPISIRYQIITLYVSGVFIAACAFQIHFKFRALFRRFDHPCAAMAFMFSCEFHNSESTVHNFVGFQPFIRHNGFCRLQSCASGIHEEVLVAGLIACGRRDLFHFVQSRPKFSRSNRSILSLGFKSFHHHGAFFINHLSLTVPNILARQKPELRPRQNAVAAGSRSADAVGLRKFLSTAALCIGIVSVIFFRIALVQLEFDLHRLVCGL